MLRNKTKGFIVTIDGPSGAGKSTVSQKLASTLKGHLLDTGAMYRSVAYFALQQGKKNPNDIAKIARTLKFSVDAKTNTLLVNGKKLGTRIRTERVSQMASLVSKHPGVRSTLTQLQRRVGHNVGKSLPTIVEGRDIGTVVFPGAPFKFFVTADPEVRAKRRFLQLKKQGIANLTFKEVLTQNENRDRQDSMRKLAPLKCPEDAVVVDTTSMRISQVVRFMKDHIYGKLNLPKTFR